jgi:hypothetical protein
MASDELRDTLFFASGELVAKEKGKDTVTLSVPNVTVVIRHNRNIKINGASHNSISDAKRTLQRILC